MATEIEGFEQIEQPEQRAARKARAKAEADKPTGLWPSLIAARQGIKPLAKSADNPFYHSKYVPLEAILAAVNPALWENRLYAYGRAAGAEFVTTIVHVETGEYVEDRRPFIGAENAQHVGAQSSYSFRYGLAFLMALELVGEDEDGNNSGNVKNPEAPARQAAPAGRVSAARPTSPPQQTKGGGRGALKAVTCPRCNVTGAIIPGKPEFGGGWLCWPKMPGTAGCGAKYDSDPLTWPRTRAQEAAAQVDARIEDEPPPIGDDDLPF